MSLRPRRITFGEIWPGLKQTVEGVITCGNVNRSTWNDKFTDVYSLCVANPEPLGERLYAETKAFLETHVSALHEDVCAAKKDDKLQVYYEAWEQYRGGSNYLDQLYGYLNTQYIKKQKVSEADLNYGSINMDLTAQMMEIGELSLDIWRRVMIDPIKKDLVDMALRHIDRNRSGETVNSEVIHSFITSLVTVENFQKNKLKLYEELFETSFLKETGEYYRGDALKLHDKYTCSEYMEKVLQRLDDENLRSRKFLHSTSYDKVTQECNQRLVADHKAFLDEHCRDMVRKEQNTDLHNMYRILMPIKDGLTTLTGEVEKNITAVLLEAINIEPSAQLPALFVDALLERHDKYSKLIQEVFNNDQQFIGAMDRAFAAAINHKKIARGQCLSPKLLAKYCDTLLRKTAKGMNESEIDDKLAQSITIFKYLDDKDYYQRFYAQMLARRLIFGMSMSMEAEEAMINRLKTSCGYEFTNKLHRMYTDVALSSDLTDKFHKYVEDKVNNDKHPGLGVQISVQVLQDGAWPIGHTKTQPFSFPSVLETSITQFEHFYSINHNGRKLAWIPYFCQADLKMNHLSKPYLVTMGLYHMAMLLPFNNSETLSLKDMIEITRLSDVEAQKHLTTLLETKLLVAEEGADEQTVYKLNMSYSNKRTRFKITTAMQKEPIHEVHDVHTQADEDRKMFLQAAIVRIMKSRRLLKHNLLIQEVISQSRARFAPRIGMIKKCIETLIDKDYLERLGSDQYGYLA